jgi:solute carrier family 25 folate transporter 32
MEGLFGLIANGISTIITHPIDVIKTNYQLAQTQNNIGNRLGARSIVQNVWRSRGVRGFYAGLTPNLCTYPIFWAVYFGTNQMMGDRKFFENKYVDRFAKSYTAGLIGSSLTNPLFVLKIRMQNSNRGGTRSVIQTIRDTNRLGIRAYYRGLGSTYLNNLKLAIQFPLYDVIKDRTDSVVLSSFTAKTISSSLTYPLDLIRVNQRNSDQKIGIGQVVRQIYGRHGGRGMYRGVLLYNAVTTPNFIIMMVGYEALKSMYNS